MTVRCVPVDELVGCAEIADWLGVSRQTVTNWRARWADFPAPIADLACGPIFDWRDVERWLLIEHETTRRGYTRRGRPVKGNTHTLKNHMPPTRTDP